MNGTSVETRGFWASIGNFFATVWEAVRTAFSRMWYALQEHWKPNRWLKILLIDIPFMVGIVWLTFTAWGFVPAEVLVLALGTYGLVSFLPEERGIFKYLLNTVIGIAAFAAMYWMWLWVRELAWILALSQVPRLTDEMWKVYTETRERALHRRSVKSDALTLEAQEASVG